MKKIPDRWEIYKPVGAVVRGTRFLPFKVPLQERLSRFLPDGIAPFTPEDLVNHTKEQGFNLGLVIDLTNTKKYYSKEHIEKYNIEYEKIFTEGHVVPSSKVRGRFFDVVDQFLKSNPDDNVLIGVHCTHGLNRTGYLVCRYMIDKMNRDPEDSISAFNEARGHDMERQNYLDDLRFTSYPAPSRNGDNGDFYAEAKVNSTTLDDLQHLDQANFDSPFRNGPQFGIPADFDFRSFDSPYLGREWPQYGEDRSHDQRASPRGYGTFGRQRNPRSRDSPRGSWRGQDRSDRGSSYHDRREPDDFFRSPRQSHRNDARSFSRGHPYTNNNHPHFYRDFGRDLYPPPPFGFYPPEPRRDRW